MNRRDFLGTLAVGFTLGAIAAAAVGGALSPKGPALVAAAAAADDPPGPRQGIVEDVHFFAPGGPGGPLHLAGSNGAGGRWAVTLRVWDREAQITWNAAPVPAWELIGNLSVWQANVIYWPLAELDGAALRADFTQR